MEKRSVKTDRKYRFDAIYGFSDLLFPRKDLGSDGFIIPKSSKSTSIPRIVLTKGAPGSGKSTLTIQMIVEAIKGGFKTAYWYTHGDHEYIKNTCERFEMCSEEVISRIKKSLSVVTIDEKIKLEKGKTAFWEQISNMVYNNPSDTNPRLEPSLKKSEILFIDSLNIHDIPDRDLARKFFNKLLQNNLLCFICVEDYTDQGTPRVRQLIADCDFKADVIIELREDERSGYTARSIKVSKMRYGPQLYGKHLMKICSPWHSLYNINRKTGIVIYHSLNNYLSESRIDTFLLSDTDFVKTGITHLDSILIPHQSGKNVTGKSIPPNASIVVQGNQGGYMLPIGMNILMGGMWECNESNHIHAGQDVLAVMLNEETNIDLNEIPIPYRTDAFTNKSCEISFDNGNRIRWRRHIGIIKKEAINKINDTLWEYLISQKYLDKHGNVHRTIGNDEFINTDFQGCERAVIDCIKKSYHGGGHFDSKTVDDYQMSCRLHELFGAGNNYAQKVIINKWCGYIINEKNEVVGCKKLVIANYRPGNITPEEFISSLKLLLNDGGFKRALFFSTAQIQMRFPLLANEKLFFPVLIDVFKSRNIVSVFIDPSGDGRDTNISFGLSNMADYVIDIVDEPNDLLDKIHLPDKLNQKEKDKIKSEIKENVDECSWAKLYIQNIRGQSYACVPHAVTIRPRFLNEISICDLVARLKLPTTIASNLFDLLIQKKIITKTGTITPSYNSTHKGTKKLLSAFHSDIQKIIGVVNMTDLYNLFDTIRCQQRVGKELFIFNLRENPERNQKSLPAINDRDSTSCIQAIENTNEEECIVS